MDPAQLQAWEKILQSSVAVALLLLLGLFVICGAQSLVIRVLWKELRASDAALREVLAAQGDFAGTVGASMRAARQVLALTRSQGKKTDGIPD